MRVSFPDHETSADKAGESRRLKTILWTAAFLLSSLAFSAIGSYSSALGFVVSTLVRFGACAFCAFYARAVESALANAHLSRMIPSAIFGGVLLVQITKKALDYPNPYLPGGVIVLLAILAVPAVMMLSMRVLTYASQHLLGVAKSFARQTSRFERWYLVIAFAVLSLACVLLYANTNLFYATVYQGKPIPYDVVYTSDSAVILKGNAYFDIYHVTNDLRQPLFGLFAMPFVLPATLLSKILFFLPLAYPVLINLTQIALVLITILMIARLTGLEARERAFAILILTFAYPTLLFSLNLEQYVFAVFWLIAFLFLAGQRARGADFAFIGMTGSLLTSGIFLPFMTSGQKLSSRIRQTLLAIAMFFIVVVLLNRQYVFFTGFSYFKQLLGSYGGAKISMLEKAQQFSAMLEGLFFRPEAQWTTFAGHPAYLLAPVTGFSWGGIAVLLLAVTGFALNRRNRFAQFSFVFVLVSVALHAVIGWGAKENGMTLYAYYYLWAYVTLIYLGLERLLSPLKQWRFVAYGVLCAALLGVNLGAIIDLVRFGLTYYPA